MVVTTNAVNYFDVFMVVIFFLGVSFWGSGLAF